MDAGDSWRLALLIICLGLSGLFSASETAFIALPRARLMHLVRTGGGPRWPHAAVQRHLLKAQPRLSRSLFQHWNQVADMLPGRDLGHHATIYRMEVCLGGDDVGQQRAAILDHPRRGLVT